MKTKIRLLLYTFGIWFLLVIVAILNGLFRNSFIEPKVGEYAAHIISTILLVCIILVVVSLFISRIKIDYTKTDLLLIGTIWLILSILFEFVFGHYVLGISWDTLLADYNILNGRIWSLVLLVEFISPLLFGLKSQIRNKLDIYSQKLLGLLLESKLLLRTGGALIFLFLIIAYAYPHSFSNNLDRPTDVLATNATILATIFAITISLTVLGLQYLSESLTPRIVDSFIKTKFIAGLLFSYIFSILINIFVISFPIIEVKNFVYYSYLLLIWCVFYLASYLFYMIRKIQPTSALYEIEKQIPVGYDEIIIHKFNQKLLNAPDEQDKFIDLEQIIIKTIRNNDFYSFIACLNLLFKKQNTYLENIYKKGPDDKQGYKQIHNDAEAISLYFLRINKQIYFEVLREKNERFLLHYTHELIKIITLLLKLKATGPLWDINDHFNDIGLQIIEGKFQSIFKNYCLFLDKVAKEEFQNIPSGNLFLEFHEDMVPFNTLPKKERDERSLGHIIYGYFSYHRLKFYEELSMKASDRGYEIIIVWVKNSLTELLDQAIKKDDNKKMQISLVNDILNTLKNIHDYSLTKNINISFFGLFELNNTIESLKDEGTINSVGVLTAKFYCDGTINSIKKDYYFDIIELGAQGRVLISKYPQITEIVVDSLIDCLKIVSEDNKFKKINKEMVINELNSIKRLNEHKHKRIDDKIDKAFIKYKVKIKSWRV